MRFTPQTESEIQSSSLMKEGIYAYQVIESKEKTSHAGNEYISLILKIWDEEGREHTVYTNLALIKLLKHFCDVNNMQQDYDTGFIDATKCENKSGGRVVIAIEGEKPNPAGGTYKAKNIVKDYVLAHKDSALESLKEKNGFKDDDIPF